MSETIMSDEFPDRLSVDPNSPYYNADILQRDVGIRFKGMEKTNVEEYCVSEGWIRVAVGAKRATTLPERSTRNLVKFHLMDEPSRPVFAPFR